MSERRNLVVVGGGPAGLATAIEARMAGLDVVVVEGRQPPVDVACGEGLMPGGVCRLHRLGVHLPEEHGQLFSGVRYLDGDVVAEATFGFSSGIGIRRTTLHQALADRAASLGAELRWGARVEGFDGDRVTTNRGVIRGRWLVAADGRLSRMREWAGIAVKRPKRRRFGRRRHVSIRPWADLVEVHWGTSCEVYVTPVGPELVGVAVLTGDRPVDFDRCLAQFPALADRLAGAPVASEDRGAGPFGQRPEHVVAGRLALVGDASGCLDPITGEGLSLAFGQAAAVVAAIVDGDLSYYAARHRGMARFPAAITRFLLAVEQRPDLRRRLIRTFAAWPRLFGRLVDLVGAAGLSPSGGSAR